MKKEPLSAAREKIVADAICTVASELRLIDVADLISMLRYERHGDLADLVSSAAEMFFLPGIVRLGFGGDYFLDWEGQPRVVLDLEIKPIGVDIYARLILEQNFGGIEINHIAFSEDHGSEQEETAFLTQSLRAAAFRPFISASAIANPAV